MGMLSAQEEGPEAEEMIDAPPGLWVFLTFGVSIGLMYLVDRLRGHICFLCRNRINPRNRITGRYVEFYGARAHLTCWLEEAKETYVGTSRFPTKTPKVPQFKRALQRLRRRQEAEKQ